MARSGRSHPYIPAGTGNSSACRPETDESWRADPYIQVTASATRVQVMRQQLERDDSDDDGIRGRRGIRAPYRSVPARTAGALLPDARLRARRRGSAAGDFPARVARARRLRRAPGVAAHLAVPDRDERVPDRAGAPQPPPAAVRPRQPGPRPGCGPGPAV